LAIAIEFVNVIVRKSAVEAKYPGGLDGFVRQQLANYLEDEHILRVGFMSGHDAFRFVEELQAAGLCHADDGASDLAVITWDDTAVPSWLTVGECEGRAACWLSDRPPGRLMDLDPGMLLRCSAFGTIDEIVGVFCRCGAEIRQRVPAEGSETVLLECERGGARLEVEVFKDSTEGRPLGVWGRRDLTRRTSMAADAALMRDLTSALKSAEEVPPAPGAAADRPSG
jgi:hypothetical protein